MTPPDFTNDQSATNAPITSAPDTGGTNPQASQPTAQPQTPTPQPVQATPVAQTSQARQPSSTQPSARQQPQTGMASNPYPVDPNANHPAVRVASILNSVGQALAGGARTVTRVDPVTGETTRSVMPLSNKQIGLALAASALSGAFNGLAQKGPGAQGAAAASGFQQGFAQQQAIKQQQEAQAQSDAETQSKLYARQAATFEANSRTILNTSQAEAHGADTIDKLVAINRASGILDVDSDSVDNGGTPVTQAELQQKIKDGSISFSDTLGPIAGRVEVTAPDGSKHWEATHLLIKDPAGLVTVTPEAWKMYSDAGVPGFSANTTIGEQGAQIKRSIIQNANEQVASKTLVESRLKDLKTELAGTQYADQVPTSIDFTQPGVRKALQAYQKYVSHNSDNLADPFAALQAMGADTRNPTTGAMEPNSDAKFVDAAASALGGWSVLQAAHNQIAADKKNTEQFSIIDSETKAEAVLSAPKKFSSDQVSAAKNFVSLSQQLGVSKAVSEVLTTLNGGATLLHLPHATLQARANELEQQNKENPTLNAIGEGAESLAEFMTGDAALKALPISQRLLKISKVAQVLEDHPLVAKAFQIGASAIRGGVTGGVEGTVKAADTNDLPTSLEKGAVAGVATGAGTAALGALGTIPALYRGLTAAPKIQSVFQGGVRDVLDSVAKDAGVTTSPAASIRDVAGQVADAVEAKAKTAYQALDDATEGRFQRFQDSLKNINQKLRETAGLDDDAEEALLKRKAEVEKAQQETFKQAKAAGVDPATVDSANADWKKAQALHDLDRQLKMAASGMRPELAASGVKSSAELLDPGKAFLRLNRLYDSGRLQQAVGKDAAQTLMQHADNAFVSNARTIALQKGAKAAAKVVGVGAPTALGIGLGTKELFDHSK
jgi:hypothetical protein